jgi:glycosyl hydrolase family 35/beta-galactosidase-like protein
MDYDLTRRRFLKSALATPLAAAVGLRGAETFALALRPGPQALFENPYIIRYDAHCFTLHDKDQFIFGGTFHYARCPRELWRDRLEKLQRAGLNTIETYVFWNYHEPREGQADLTEFEDFVKLVKEMGFWMVARPGPYACAEWDSGGFPRWVVAQRFPLRSDDPRSIETSRHWYGLVLPVIQRHQITTGGPIIMVQLENEYDYCPHLSEPVRLAYVKALAETAWAAGINVPLITCWTRQARENKDPDMARVMDTCNFYPRWAIVKEVVPALKKLRAEEPNSPVAVTELQGGWFSEFGGKLSVDQEGVDAAQLNALTKTVVEQGATSLNYYMGFGGTNFDWAAKSLTTTYDYAAPLREPGGIWEKYDAARLIGATLGLVGPVLARAEVSAGIVQSTNPAVSVTERESGKTGVLFVRENANAEQKYKLVFPDPNSPTRRPISIPREGELTLGAHEMKMLPVQLPVPGGHLRYTTADVFAVGEISDREYLIVYDQPGRVVEIGLATRDEPHIEGETVYQYWDPEFESVVFGLRVEKKEKVWVLNNHQLIVVAPAERARGAWTAEFSPKVLPYAEETKPMRVPFFADAELLRSSGETKKALWAEFEFRPGDHDLTALLPPEPSKCLVDGAPAELHYARPQRSAALHLSTPPLPVEARALNDLATWVERFDVNSGEWRAGPLGALDDTEDIPYGYVKYRAEFNAAGDRTLFVSSFAEDGKKVFVDGKLLEEASNAKGRAEAKLAGLASGTHTLEISYESFGSPNFGEKIGELKGLESVRVGTEERSATPIETWQVQRFQAGVRGRRLDPEFGARGWTPVSLSAGAPKGAVVPAFTWCRAEFKLDAPPREWFVPMKLVFEADRDALLYLNGRFVGRYVTVGPQSEFYLPEPYLGFGEKSSNTLMAVLAYSDGVAPIRTLRIAPYEEFATRRTKIEFEW